jgi:hypothetical protein
VSRTVKHECDNTEIFEKESLTAPLAQEKMLLKQREKKDLPASLASGKVFEKQEGLQLPLVPGKKVGNFFLI